MSQTKLRRLTTEEFQIVFLYMSGIMPFDTSDRDYHEWKALIVNLISKKSLMEQHSMLNRVLTEDRHLYKQYLAAYPNEN